VTPAQVSALQQLSTRPHMSTGPGSAGLHGVSGSTLMALERRGLVVVEYIAITCTTYYSLTDAGRAALSEAQS
jgi:hypothetical protein